MYPCVLSMLNVQVSLAYGFVFTLVACNFCQVYMWDLIFHLQVVQFLHWLHKFYVRSFDVTFQIYGGSLVGPWVFGWVMVCYHVEFKLTQVHVFVFTYWASDQWDAGMLFVASVSKFASSLLMVDAVLVYTFHCCFEVLDIVVCCKAWTSLEQLWR